MRVTIRKTGLYVSHGGGLGGLHTSYHADGKTWIKLRDEDGNEVTQNVRLNPPLRELKEPIMVENATVSIDDDTFDAFDLRSFSAEQRPDSVVFLDTRALTGGLHYQVWAVPPGQVAKVPLFVDWPGHLHIVTHTNPWLMLIVYEQGRREDGAGAELKPDLTV